MFDTPVVGGNVLVSINLTDYTVMNKSQTQDTIISKINVYCKVDAVLRHQNEQVSK